MSISLIFTSCKNETNASNNEKIEQNKIDSVVVKSSEKVKSKNSIEGNYINSMNTKLLISNVSEKGFNYECEAKTECGGLEKIKGYANFVDKTKAVSNVTSEFDGEIITIKQEGEISFEPNGMFIGMDCQQIFDVEFIKK
jgi:hypothetical protein